MTACDGTFKDLEKDTKGAHWIKLDNKKCKALIITHVVEI